MPKETATNSELSSTLRRNRRIWRRVNSLDVDSIRPSDLALIEKTNEEILNYLSPSQALEIREWKDVNRTLAEIAKCGRVDQKSCLTALLLVGAAISRPDINLRGDLDRSIRETRSKYLDAQLPGTDLPVGGGTVGRRRLFSMVPAFGINTKIVNTSVEFYNTLCAGSNTILAQRIKEILEDSSKTIRVGFELSKLKLKSLREKSDEYLFSEKRHEEVGRTRLGNDVRKLEKNKTVVPKNFHYSNDFFRCIRQNETGTDETFWVSFFTYIENAKEVYDLIDEAVRTNSLLNLELGSQVKFVTKRFKTPIIRCNANSPSKHWGCNIDFGSHRLYKGFLPWGSNTKCIEDDNQEYDAVSEVFDDIADAAAVVSRGASVVAAVSGPTVVAAGAALVSVAAGVVSLCSDVAGSVVDIVNFFDDNDLIGDIVLSGKGDYTGRPEAHSKEFELKTPYARSEGYYALNQKLIFSGVEPVDRNWSCMVEHQYDPWEKHSGILGMGNDGDKKHTINFNSKMTMILGSGIDLKSKRSYSSAKWVKGPKLNRTKTKASGTVHWGVSWNHTVEYHPWVSGLRIMHPL